MSPYKYREFNEQDEVIETRWRQWLVQKTTREATTDLMNKVERLGIRWLCTISGFAQIEPISKGRYLFELFLDCVGAITILRGFFVIVIPYDSVRIALGDLFIGSQAHAIQNMLITFLLILSCGLRYLSFLSESRGRMETFRIYDGLRSTKFDHKQFMLTPADCSHIRKAFFPLLYFFLIATPLTCLGIAGWLTFAFVSNPINYENLYNSVIIGIWTIVISGTFTIDAYPSFWHFSQNTMIMAFVAFALNSNKLFGQLLVKSGPKADQRDLFKYFRQQNKIYNLINSSTVDLGKILFYGVIVVSMISSIRSSPP
ncbi:uncharacterized protein LOC128392482 [Panonychus citri]|uniref:uncharacterized protein LOC128392482 n=1 Tax=Panonychus citri TaxID=50023 RepID=UPI0023082ECC|nr:uncharacterized protein LOC128392482 [Panonychus citri]